MKLFPETELGPSWFIAGGEEDLSTMAHSQQCVLTQPSSSWAHAGPRDSQAPPPSISALLTIFWMARSPVKLLHKSSLCLCLLLRTQQLLNIYNMDDITQCIKICTLFYINSSAASSVSSFTWHCVLLVRKNTGV